MCVPLKRVPSGSLPFFDVGAIYDSTTLHNILLSTRVPRDSSLLCDRTIYIYIYASRLSCVRSMFRQHERPPPPTEIEDEKKKPLLLLLLLPSFGTRQRKAFFFLTSHYSKSFRIPRGVFVLAARAAFLVEFLFQECIHVSLSRHLFHALKFLGHHVQREVRFRASIVIRRRVPRVPGVLPRLVDDLQHRRLQRRLKLATHRRRDGTADACHGRARGFSAPFTVGSDARHPRRFLLNGEVSFVAL